MLFRSHWLQWFPVNLSVIIKFVKLKFFKADGTPAIRLNTRLCYFILFSLILNHCSATASLIPRATNIAANDRCSHTIIFGELTTCFRTIFDEMPYRIKTINVIVINTTLKTSISNIGDEVVGDTKSGRKAKKNIYNLGLRILIKKPFIAICLNPFLW